MRSSAAGDGDALERSGAFDAGLTGAACTGSPLFLEEVGRDRLLGTVITVQRRLALSSLKASAVYTWVPSGCSGLSIVTGASNTGSKPLRTNTLPSLRLTNTAIGPGLSGRTSGTASLFASLPRRSEVVSRGVPVA